MKKLFKDLNIVTIGGGTGLSTLLMGLKKYNNNISAIIATTDDGGSSGKLRKEFDIIPPGDIRNCLLALSKENTILLKLFRYRFNSKNKEYISLAGHNFGNLFIMAISDIFGSFEKGIKEIHKILLVNGKIIPSTFEKINLVAEKIYKNDKKIIYGETNISNTKGEINNLWIEPKNIKASPDVIKAIKKADGIILGPGSFYTSIITNILLFDIKNEIIKNKKAKKIFILNIMEEPEETIGYKTKKYFSEIERYLGKNIINFLLVNDNTKLTKKILNNYKKNNINPIFDDIDIKFCQDKNFIKITKNFLNKNINKEFVARHNSIILAETIRNIFEGNK